MPAEQDDGASEQRDARTIGQIRVGHNLPVPGLEGRSQDDIYDWCPESHAFLKGRRLAILPCFTNLLCPAL